MVTRVDPFLGGLGIDATSKFEVASNATVTVGDGTSTGNVNVGGEVVSSTVDATTLKIGGTAITATAAELNLLDGVTATTAELNYTDGVTSNIQTQLDGKQASGSYLTGNQTITLSGDASGSGTTAITVTVADDSHNHIISNVDGLQTALDAKLESSSYTAADVLTKIKTVDGSGSGLDADLLDGQQGSYYLNTSTSFGGDVSGTYNAIVIANDSHTHAFDNLTGKTSGTGEYSTDHFITAGRGSGGVSLTHNDGHGNANITWNHKAGVPEQNGNAARIHVNTDASTNALMVFQLKAGVSSGAAVTLTQTLALSETNATFLGNTLWHAGNDGSGSGLDADTLDGVQGASYLRSDTADTATRITLTDDLVFSNRVTTDGHIQLYGALSSTGFAIGIEASTLYNRSGSLHRWYIGTFADGGSSDYMELSTSGLTVNGTINASNDKLQEGGNALIPAGSIIMYGAASAPGGWYLCEGGAISRSTYAALFSAIGTTYGVGDGSTTFNVPDFRDRAPYGASTFTLGSKTAGEVNASGQNSTGTGTTGSTGGSTVANTTGSGGPTTHTVTTSTTNSTTDKDVSNAITVVTGVNAHAAHTHTIPSLTVNGHTHSVPSLTVTHPGVAVKFIIKT